MSKSGCRPRPLEVSAVSSPTASPSQNHCGRAMSDMNAHPGSPNTHSTNPVKPTFVRSNWATCRYSWVPSRSNHSLAPIVPACGGVLNHSLRRGASVTNPLLATPWFCSTSDRRDGVPPMDAATGPAIRSRRCATRWASSASARGYTISKCGDRSTAHAIPGGFCCAAAVPAAITRGTSATARAMHRLYHALPGTRPGAVVGSSRARSYRTPDVTFRACRPPRLRSRLFSRP